jgi:DTW domain-containing protein YfiP
VSPIRRKRKPRCPGCGLPPRICACDLMPRVRVATPIAIVQHVGERYKPTNTGRLFVRMAEGTALLPCGMHDSSFDPAPLQDPSIEWLLLYPQKGAPVLEEARKPAAGRRLGFVLLDGSWSQCSHLSRRLPVVADLPCVILPPGPPSFWTVRAQHHEQGKSTFEAAVDLIRRFEGPAVAEPLRRAFAVITARQLHLKGRLKSPDVPASWGI